jgi:hypothetical protein
MSTKRLIIVLVLFLGVAGLLVGFAAGSSGHKKNTQKQPPSKGTTRGGSTMGPDATKKYWTPERMKNARPAPMNVPGGSKSSPSDSGQTSGSSKPSGR